MNFHPRSPVRSWLFAPGSNARVITKALASGSDAIILDLEDAVSLSEKDSARALVASLFSEIHRPNVHIRVNALPTPFAFDDILEVVKPGLAGIVLPKTDNAQDVALLDWLLSQAERGAGLADRTIEIMPLLETAAGISNALPIALSSPRVRQLSFGAGDFTLELGIHWSREETELYPARSAVVLASRTANIAPPVDAVWVEMGDREGMAQSARRSRDHGFQGKLCIHPDQVAAVHDAYAPNDSEIFRARRIVEAFEEAQSRGIGAAQVDGKMIDYPIVEIARRTLADAIRS